LREKLFQEFGFRGGTFDSNHFGIDFGFIFSGGDFCLEEFEGWNCRDHEVTISHHFRSIFF